MNGCTRSSINAALLALLVSIAALPLPVAADEPLASAPARKVKFYRECVARFIDRGQAAEFLATEDAFLAGLSRFDLQSRLQTTDEPTKADYLAMTSEQVLDWEKEEITRLSSLIATVKPELEKYDLPFPEEIVLIKYSGQGEAGAAYTRLNGIVFPRHKLSAEAPGQRHLLLHELFHVLSRHDGRLRRELYGVIGFKPCNSIELPESFADLKITNPDAPTIDFYIALDEVDGDGNRSTRDAVPVLLASREYDPQHGRTLFDYLEFKLMLIEQVRGVWQPLLAAENGETAPVLLDGFANESYRRQIGRNTDYVIHPDEVLADNFALLVAGREELPSPEIMDAIRRLLQAPEPAPPP